MGLMQVRLPEKIQTIIDRQIAIGRIASTDAYPVEAARRYAEDLAGEDEIVAEARAGIADAEAARFVTVATPEDAETLQERTMARLRGRLRDDN